MADPLSNSRPHSLVPSFLYSSSSSMTTSTDALRPSVSSSLVGAALLSKRLVVPAPKEKVEMYSAGFYAACGVGGMLSTGLTHLAVTPIDLVKECYSDSLNTHASTRTTLLLKESVLKTKTTSRSSNGHCGITYVDSKLTEVTMPLNPKTLLQIDPIKYKSIISGFGVLLKEQGIRGLFKGWAPTWAGYSVQGAGKFGLYEFFKKYYSDVAGPEYAAKYKTLIYLAGSASAEVIADVALCPMEAVKVRVQTQPGFARGLTDGLPKFIKSEGALGLYKGMVPLWGRQVPYTMMKFASFETIIELMYKHAIPTPKEQCSKPLQLGVSFASGYIAGVFCAVVSHPADNLVSFLNNAKGATFGEAVKKLGVLGLFTRGLPLRIIMIGTLTGGQWVIYDAFKVFVGLPTTGGPAPAAAVIEVAKS
ncbi:unnamed protein product [Malus baccata var. baccata]